jgi:hypothetical protein
MCGKRTPAHDSLAIEGECASRLPARSVWVPVADSTPREAGYRNQRARSHEMTEAREPDSPAGVEEAGRIAHNRHIAWAADRGAPALGLPSGSVADRDPLHARRVCRAFAQYLQRPLCKRTAGVAQERDDRRTAGLECDWQLARGLAGPRRGNGRQRAGSQECPWIHVRKRWAAGSEQLERKLDRPCQQGALAADHDRALQQHRVGDDLRDQLVVGHALVA